MGKAMTLRLSDEQAEALEALAQVEGIAISDAVRQAIDQLIEDRKKDTAFRKRVRESIAKNQRILERLGK